MILLPVALTVLSGMAFRVGRSWFGLSGDFGRWMMAVHEGRYLGEPLVPLYVLCVGLALLAMIGSGLSLLGRSKLRSWHARLAPLLVAPLLVSAITGISFRLGKAWFDLPAPAPAPAARWLLKVHQGSYLGKDLRVFYVLLLGLGALALLGTGLGMTRMGRRRSAGLGG
ncbi:MAG: hypothetical protein ACK55D_16830 [Synechococcaceae cyanobacterium]